MRKKYNLALTPISQGDKVIALAKKFSTIADKYLLGNNSFPHVTLYHFDAEEGEIANIWKTACDRLKALPLFLTFNKFSCITFDNAIFWVSLLPDNGNIIHGMHASIADILQLPVKQTFDPHMTLINTRNNQYVKEAAVVAASYQPIADGFTLSLGVSDDVGQLISIIYSR